MARERGGVGGRASAACCGDAVVPSPHMRCPSMADQAPASPSEHWPSACSGCDWAGSQAGSVASARGEWRRGRVGRSAVDGTVDDDMLGLAWRCALRAAGARMAAPGAAGPPSPPTAPAHQRPPAPCRLAGARSRHETLRRWCGRRATPTRPRSRGGRGTLRVPASVDTVYERGWSGVGQYLDAGLPDRVGAAADRRRVVVAVKRHGPDAQQDGLACEEEEEAPALR